MLVDRLKPHLLGASEATTAGKAFSADLFAEELRMHTHHLRAFDRRIAELLGQHPDAPIFLSSRHRPGRRRGVDRRGG